MPESKMLNPNLCSDQYRGKARARIIRYKKTRDARVEKHALFGMWADNSQVADVDRYVRDLRKGRF